MMLISCFNYQFYKRPVMQRLIVTAMIVCAGIALVLGVSSNGSQRWIEVGGIQLQPSEIVKLLIILYLPSVCVKHPLRFWRRPPQSNYPPSSVRDYPR